MKITEAALRKKIRQEIKQSQNLDEGVMDWLQGGLDIVGLIPGVGEAADGLNAAISLGRGNPLEAVLSLVSMIPVAGDAVGKGGKLALKILDPVMDLIKAGAKHSDIIKKVGPDAIKKSSGVFNLLKDTIVKHEDKIKKGFKAVKDGDLEAVESVINVKIPDIARNKASELLKKSANQIDATGMGNVLKFFTGLETKDMKPSKDPNKEKLAANYYLRGYPLVENASIAPYILGEEYINEKLSNLADYFITEGVKK